jgi:hypothetical protein
MRSDDPEFLELVVEFQELAEPDVILAKELYAHFGLLFYVFGLAEHALMNIAVTARLYERYRKGEVVNSAEREKEWDRIAPQVEALTFGKLVSEVSKIPEFLEQAEAMSVAKRDRDYFAHRFFRENAGLAVTDEGVRLLLVRLNQTRRQAETFEASLDQPFAKMRTRMRLPKLDEGRIANALEELEAQAASDVASRRVRWK